MTAERILVTGAGRGLGLAFVHHWAARGARVFAAVRDPARAEDLHRLADERPDRVTVLPLDVTDEAAIEEMVGTIAADGDGRLDVLVNNAGVSPRGEEFTNLDAERMGDVFRVNAIAPMIVARHCAPLLRRSDHPRIANISSAMGSLADKDYGRHYSYSASKAALNMLTRAAAADLKQERIVVTALHPGWVRTDLGGPNAVLTPEESVAGMTRVIDELGPAASGEFLTWQGDHHPW